MGAENNETPSSNTPRIQCQKCQHYRVSWDVKSPHSCTVYGFKSQRMPAQIVWLSTGELCQSYELKHTKNNLKND